MKKTIYLVLLLPILILITGCEGLPFLNGDPKETHKLGDVVKTDIAKFKLLDSKYTYALNNSIGNELGKAKEYNADSDSSNPYVAAKGNTLVAITFSLENNDRSEINMDWNFLTVKIDGKKYNPDIKYLAESNDNLNWNSYNSSNIIILASKKVYYRCYLDIDKDVKDLDSDVELLVELPTSEKKETFKYVITKKDRDSYKGEEIDLDVAIENFEVKEVRNYFKENSKDYKSLTGEEIKQALTDKTFNTCQYDKGTWTGTFKFESSGKIFEGGNKYARGYINNRTWSVSNNNLVLGSKAPGGNPKTRITELKKIKDNTYLELENNEPVGILYKNN